MSLEVATEEQFRDAMIALGQEGNTSREKWEIPRVVPISDVPMLSTFGKQRIEFAVEGFVAKSAITMIAGDAGTLKSTLAISMGRAVADGLAFAGMSTGRSNVAILDRENSLPVVQERYDRCEITDGANLIHYGAWAGNDAPAAWSQAALDFVRTSETKPLVVFDSYIAFHEGDENDAAATRRAFAGYRQLANLGAAVLLLHHTGKGETSKDYRGSSDIKAAVDNAYRVELMGDPTRPDGIRLTAFKSRFNVAPSIVLRFDGHRFTTEKGRTEDLRTNRERLRDLLISHPGIGSAAFEKLAASQGLGRDRARKFITGGKHDGTITVTRGRGSLKQIIWVNPPVRISGIEN